MSRKIIGSVVLNPTSSAPTSPTEGEMYYNSDDSNLYIYDGSQWNRVGEADQVIKYTQDFTSQTSVVVAHGLGTIPMIQVYNGSGEVLVADTITHDSINQTTVTFGVAQTGTILCIGSESSNSPIAYTTQYTTTFTAQTSVTVTHNLGAKPIVQVRDSGDEILIPTSINHTTDNSLVVTFDSSESGYVECIVGGVSNISPSGNADMVDGFNASATPEANKLLALDGSAKLPAVDGSQLTNVQAGSKVLIDRRDVTAVSNVEFTNLPVTGYDYWEIYFDMFGSTSSQLVLQLDNEVGSNYKFRNLSSTALVSTTGTSLLVAQTTGNCNTSGKIIAPTIARVSGQYGLSAQVSPEDNGASALTNGLVIKAGIVPENSFKFSMLSGTMTGIFTLFGIKNS